MLDETIELLTEQMIECDFKNKEDHITTTIKMTKIQLYQFCIKLVKLIRKIENE